MLPSPRSSPSLFPALLARRPLLRLMLRCTRLYSRYSLLPLLPGFLALRFLRPLHQQHLTLRPLPTLRMLPSPRSSFRPLLRQLPLSFQTRCCLRFVPSPLLLMRLLRLPLLLL